LPAKWAQRPEFIDGSGVFRFTFIFSMKADFDPTLNENKLQISLFDN
jgi:hypothetical protein